VPVPDEVPLTGGRITSGVVRVGDTVRRPASARSEFVAELLALLVRQGFPGAPRYLGVDEIGRDMFSYQPGWVPARLRAFSDSQVTGAGSLLRGLHDATRRSRLAGDHPVVCHYDPGPNNVVFQGERPAGFIDFDTAAPGEPLDDLGAMAWLWCWSSKTAGRPVADQARQVRLVADAYGLDAAGRRMVSGAMVAALRRNGAFWRERATGGHPRATIMIDWTHRELRHTIRHRHALDGALRG
jgi:hypothetical protein